MAVASSGQLRFLSVAKELRYNNPAATIPDSTVLLNFPNGISLTEMSTGTGAFSSYPINTYNPAADRPDGSTPHAISEFYSYDHDYIDPNVPYISAATSGSHWVGGGTNRRFDMYSISGNRAFTDPSNTDNPDPIVLTNTKWREMTFRVQSSWNIQYRPVILFRAAGTDYRRDFAINSFRETTSGALYNPEATGAEAFYNPSSDAIPTSGTWSAVSTVASNGAWVRDTGDGTPSANTGPDAGYVWNSFTNDYATGNQYVTAPADYWYFEASGSANGYAWWRPTTWNTIAAGSTEEWKFIYSAWSNDVSTWQSSYFELYIQFQSI